MWQMVCLPSAFYNASVHDSVSDSRDNFYSSVASGAEAEVSVVPKRRINELGREAGASLSVLGADSAAVLS